MTLIDEYLEYQIKYEKIYGKKTIVLLECGSFYEFYGVNNEKEKITPIIEVTQLLNIQLTRRNKSILKNDRGNPLLAGITSIAIEKYLRVLLENSYTVVKVDQITSPPNPKRAVTQIYSTGTDIDLINKPEANYLLSIYLAYTLELNIKIFSLLLVITIPFFLKISFDIFNLKGQSLNKLLVKVSGFIMIYSTLFILSILL